MNISCSNQDPCPVILDSKCVIYEGENLLYIGVTTNDNYRTALQNINTAIGNLILTGGITQLIGDVVAVGPGIASATLATVNSTPGQYGSSTAIPKLTVDGKGRVTAITTEAVFIPSGALSFIGDVTGTGNTGSNTTLTLATVNSNIYTTNTFLKFAANAKGLITSATPVVSADITGALGFTPYNSTNPSGFISGITSPMVIAALGYTPYNATNPAGFISGITGSMVTTALGYTPYNSTNPSNFISRLGLSASSPLLYDSATGNFTIQLADATHAGYLSATDWNTFNSKQAAGNYITDLIGEATATGPGSSTVTLNNSAVTGKVLTGVNITGGSIIATDSILTAFGKVQNQINGLIGGSQYQGVWNANINTPTLTSGVGVKGYYYIVSVAGSTNLDGITDWNLGDWAIFDGTAWQQVDNTDAVVSVNGQTGAVSLTTDNIPEGATNQYYLDSRARAALSFTAGSGAYNSTTGVITIPTNTSQLTNGANFITLASLSGTAPIQYNNTTGAISITQSGTASNGFLSSTDWNTFNNKQGTITLTTTGTTGAATLIGATLNIPQYQGVLTNPVTGTGTTNYLPKFTGASTIGNSIISESGTTINVAGNVKVSGDWSTTFPIYQLTDTRVGGVEWNIENGREGVGNLSFYRGATKMLLTTSGNLGLGVTPSAWFSGSVAFQLGATGVLSARNGTTETVALSSNAILNPSGNWQYIISAAASLYETFGGQHIWRTAPSGTAGNAISFTQAMTLFSTGNLGVGVGGTDAGYKLDVNGTGRFSGELRTTSGNVAVYNSNVQVQFFDTANSNYQYSLQNYSGQFRLYNNTTSTTILNFASTGAATFSSSVTATQFNVSTSGGATQIYNTGGGHTVITNATANKDMNYQTSGSGGHYFNTAGVDRLIIASSGAATFSSSVTAGGATAIADALLPIQINSGASSQAYFASNNNGTYGLLMGYDNANGYARIRNVANTALTFETNNSERMRITSGGNVGIGTTSPTDSIIGSGTFLDIAGTGGGALKLHFTNATAYGEFSLYKGSNGSYIDSAGAATASNNDLIFRTGGTVSNYGVTERMRITSVGEVCIGGTLPLGGAALTIFPVNGASSAQLSIKANNASGSNAGIYLEAPGVVGGGMYQDRNSSTLRVWQAGSGQGVQLTNNATSWGSYSDERLKDIIEPIVGGLDKVNTLRAIIGKYKTDEADKRRVFLIAQDVQNVLPEAVYDDKSEEKILSLQYTDIIPLLVNAIQELTQKVNALENK